MAEHTQALIETAGFSIGCSDRYSPLIHQPLTEPPRHGDKFSTETPTPSSASAPHRDETSATPPNPVRQNAGPILTLAGFKCLLKTIKCIINAPSN